jgi:hypothetical protein
VAFAHAIARMFRLHQHVKRKPRLRHIDDVVGKRPQPLARISRGHYHRNAWPQRLGALREVDAIEQARQPDVDKNQRDILAVFAQRSERLFGILVSSTRRSVSSRSAATSWRTPDRSTTARSVRH